MVLGRPESTRRDMGNFYRDSSLLEDPKGLVISPDEPNIVIPYPSPQDPYVIPKGQYSVHQLEPETAYADANIPPSLDSTIKTTSGDSIITDDVRQSLLLIKNRKCQYGLFTLSANKRQLVFNKCGQTSDWKDLRDSISQSKPGFVLSPLGEKGFLPTRNLYYEDSEEDALAILTGEDDWMVALKPVFGNVIAVGEVFDQTSLMTLMYQYYAPAFLSPAWWFLPSP